MSDLADSQRSAPISVIDPLSRAIVRSRDMLFRPFRIEKWLVLGFCAWLATLADCGGGSSSSNWKGQSSRRELEHGMHEAWEWFLTHLVPIVLLASLLFVVILVIWLVLLWISSRGKFLFLDGVVQDRAAVVEPWGRLRSVANSLFGFRVLTGLLAFASVVCVLLFAGLAIWMRAGEREPGPLLILMLIFAAIALIGIAIVFSLIDLVAKDFVVPLMYLRGCGVMAAWREWLRLLASRPIEFVLYGVVRIVVSFLVVLIGVGVCCLTCCIVLLPYVGAVILLPLSVFLRAWPLYFLGQLGPEYARFASLGPTPD